MDIKSIGYIALVIAIVVTIIFLIYLLKELLSLSKSIKTYKPEFERITQNVELSQIKSKAVAGKINKLQEDIKDLSSKVVLGQLVYKKIDEYLKKSSAKKEAKSIKKEAKQIKKEEKRLIKINKQKRKAESCI